MHFMTRLTLSTPFVLVLIEYLSFLLSVIGNPDVPPFW